jgi:hypothetical protein
MRRSVAAIYHPELEWSLREDCQVIYNLKHVIQSRLVARAGSSVAVIYHPELEWSLREDYQVIYNLKHVIQSRLVARAGMQL